MSIKEECWLVRGSGIELVGEMQREGGVPVWSRDLLAVQGSR